MAEERRNEVNVKLGGTEYTMRADFKTICAIERDLRMNLVPIIECIAAMDVGVGQLALIIYHGLRGYGDESLTLDQIGSHIINDGMGEVTIAATKFLRSAMNGVSLGKSQETAKDPS